MFALCFQPNVTNLLLCSAESDFRSKLVSQEEELAELKAMVCDYQTQQAVRERAQKDAQRMKGVITSQERQVRQLTCTQVY